MKIKIILASLLVIILLIVICVKREDNDINNSNNDNNIEELSMNLEINGNTYQVLLENNNTVRELLEILPASMDMRNLNGNEFYYYLDEGITSNPIDIKNIKTGDIMLYGDNCLVIFYQDFTTSYRYTKIGTITNIDGLEDLGNQDSITVNVKN